MKDFFISYNRADRTWAEWIAWHLEKSGYSVVIQAWDFREGGNFVLDMQRAIEETKRTIIVLSPDFLASRFTAPEWAAAFVKDPTGTQGRLLPVRVRDCQPGGLLAQLTYIDLVGLKSRDEARERLLAGCMGPLRPTDEPGPPQLDPGEPRAAKSPEPPWPPSIEVATLLAGGIFWRAARFAGLTMVVALAVLYFLRYEMPQRFDANSGAVYAESMFWGLLAALAVEGGLRLWRRRQARADAGGSA